MNGIVRYFIQLGSDAVELEIERSRDGSYRVRGADGQELRVESVLGGPALHRLLVAGQVIDVQPAEAELRWGQERFSVHVESERERASDRSLTRDAGAHREIIAPMPGRIVRVSCTAGESVQKGYPLVVIEAMKMQNELCSPADAVVRAVHAVTGQAVDRGAVLVEFE